MKSDYSDFTSIGSDQSDVAEKMKKDIKNSDSDLSFSTPEDEFEDKIRSCCKQGIDQAVTTFTPNFSPMFQQNYPELEKLFDYYCF